MPPGHITLWMIFPGHLMLGKNMVGIELSLERKPGVSFLVSIRVSLLQTLSSRVVCVRHVLNTMLVLGDFRFRSFSFPDIKASSDVLCGSALCLQLRKGAGLQPHVHKLLPVPKVSAARRVAPHAGASCTFRNEPRGLGHGSYSMCTLTLENRYPTSPLPR